jgi:acyl carrier protein
MSLSRDQVVAEVNQIFGEVFELAEEKLVPEAQLFSDLGLDSIDAIDLAMSFERKFGVKVDQSLIQSIRTLDDVYRTVLENQGNLQKPTGN